VWEVNADPNPGYLENYRTLYRRSVSYVDDKLAPFVDWLVSEMDATVIVTADHGEGLGPPADEVFGHKGVSSSVLDVPFLIVNPPETADLGTVSLLDLPDVVHWVLGEGTLPTREVFPAERLGDPDAPSPEWNRVERAVYSSDGWFSWDETTEGTVLAAYRDQFPEPIGALSSPSGKLRVDADVERRLHDLGYK
jgi:arylsulfatase A-like enzyme